MTSNMKRANESKHTIRVQQPAEKKNDRGDIDSEEAKGERDSISTDKNHDQRGK